MIDGEGSKAATDAHKDGVAGTSLDAEAIGKFEPNPSLLQFISTLLTGISCSGGERARGSWG